MAVASTSHQFGHFSLDEAGARVTYHQQILGLTRYEYLLLKTLLLAPERIFSRQQLMDIVWAQAEESQDRTVDTHIKTLRSKLRTVYAEDSPFAHIVDWAIAWVISHELSAMSRYR